MTAAFPGRFKQGTRGLHEFNSARVSSHCPAHGRDGLDFDARRVPPTWLFFCTALSWTERGDALLCTDAAGGVTLWQQRQPTASDTDATRATTVPQWAPRWTARDSPTPHARDLNLRPRGWAAAGAACGAPVATCAAGEATVALYLPSEAAAVVTRVTLNQMAPVCSLSWRPERAYAPPPSLPQS